MTCRIADVAVPFGVRKTFAYKVPAHLIDTISLGARVLVPFGRRQVTGYVVGWSQAAPEGDFKVRAIRDVLDRQPVIPPALIETALWVADYYFNPPGDVLRSLFPPGIEASSADRISLHPRTRKLMGGGLRPGGLCRQEEILLDILFQEGTMTAQQLSARSGLKKAADWIASLAGADWIRVGMHRGKPRVRVKQRLGIRALPIGDENTVSLTPAQRDICSRLEIGSPMVPLRDFLRLSGSTMSMARSLVRKGVVEISPMRIERMPADLSAVPACNPHVLTGLQDEALKKLSRMLLFGKAARCLLHGVTGSGKTEIYLRLIAEALGSGASALFLVPEIGLTPLLSRLVVARFPDKVSLIHSGMSGGERFDQWNRIRKGESRLVLGTRSAVFAPLDNLRLIIIDEEQDASYKQDESPRYHAREVAWQRIRRSQGVLLMGSATPSLETYHAARSEHETASISLPQRIDAKPLPEVTIVDMGREFQRQGEKTVISETLRLELEEQLERGEQSIILLNRRGYARTLLCRSCGQTCSCNDCSVSLTFHRGKGRLICHYCGMEKEPPSKCAACEGDYIYYVGVGTEQLEEMLRALLPRARLARMDRDTTRRRGALRRILTDFAEKRLDLLVGTQMLAKGHDFPNVTLVGVVGADAGLSFPDFRAAERTFQLLTQVAGRAGRGENPGRVVVQAFCPEHYALRCAQRQDYAAFYEREIALRKFMGYPPFLKLVQLLISGKNSARASMIAEKLAGTLKAFNRRVDAHSQLHILGPAVAPLEKLRGQYRFQILLKALPGRDVNKILKEALQYLSAHKLPLKGVRVDVDPLSLL